MSESVVLPALGESVTEGTVTRWLKNVGDRVEVDEPLLEVSTDKVDTEVPSPIAGVLEEILVQEDETAEVGAVLARIGDGSGSAAPAAPAAEAPAAEAPASAPAPAAEPVAAPAPAAEAAPAATPAAASGGDAQDVVLPSLGESITEGTVTRWLKNVGDQVEVDEPLLEVSTDKVDTEVPSPVAGVLRSRRRNRRGRRSSGAHRQWCCGTGGACRTRNTGTRSSRCNARTRGSRRTRGSSGTCASSRTCSSSGTCSKRTRSTGLGSHRRAGLCKLRHPDRSQAGS